tara:strand:- start:25936 stop:26595 length:660 start_codon:yes stop_codon:yes gene_type:complete
MPDLNSSIFNLIKNIFFKSFNTFVYSLLFFSFCFVSFIYLQNHFQEKSNSKYIHILNYSNVAIRPVNIFSLNNGNINIELSVIKNQYKVNDFNTYSVSARFYSNSDEKIKKIQEQFYNFISSNLDKQISLFNEYLKIYESGVVNNALEEFKIRNNVLFFKENKENMFLNYSINRNFFNHILSKSFIGSFVLLIILRVLILEGYIGTKKKNRKYKSKRFS